MHRKFVSASSARSVLWSSCVIGALFAFACDDSSKEPPTAEKPAAVTAAPAPKPAPEPEPVQKPAEVKAAPTDEASGGAAPTEAEEKKAAAPSGKKADKPAPGSKKPAPPKTEPTKEAPKEAPKEAGYTGPKPCRAKKFSFSSVKAACNKGGVKQAKALMKSFTKKGKGKGKKWKCSTCHDNTKTYTNKPNAVKELRSIF